MKRRGFITLLGGAAAAWPLGVRAQQPRTLRIGTVSAINPRTEFFWVAFDQRMRELGYIEGQNLAVEFVNLKGQIDRYGEATKELVRRNVDIIIAPGNEIALRSALAATDSLPIVITAVDYDPLALNYVTSLARPGRNVTGIFWQQIDLAVKRLELTRETFPDMRGATILWDRISADQWKAVQGASAALGMQLTGIELRERPFDYEQALAQVPPDRRGTLLALMSPVFYQDRERISDAAVRHRMPSMFGLRQFVEAGGLVSYGPGLAGMYRRAAEYVDRIARGAKAAELPIEQPTKFELILNLRTAKEIGVTLPTSILLRADEVIE
jgi:putative tryptophan/tyrosine transport system substrate-binding protein